jgi:hypothetical protein
MYNPGTNLLKHMFILLAYNHSIDYTYLMLFTLKLFT